MRGQYVTMVLGSMRTSAMLVAAALSLGCAVNTQGLTGKAVGDGSAQAGSPSHSDAHGADSSLDAPLEQVSSTKARFPSAWSVRTAA